MKFALINSFCGYGSTGSGIIRRKQQLEKMGHDVFVFYGVKKQKNEDDKLYYFQNELLYKIENRISMLTGLSGMLSFIPTIVLIRRIKKIHPDAVWLSNIHGNYVNESMLLKFLKKKGIWTVYALPDEYAFLGKCCSSYDCSKYKEEPGCNHCTRLKEYPVSLFFDNSRLKFMKKKKAYKNFDRLILRSAAYVVNKAHDSILLRDKEFYESDSSVDLSNVFYPRNVEKLKKELGITNQIVVLSCAPYRNPLKGVKFFIESAYACLDRNIIFISVGFGYDKIDVPKNLIIIPYERDKDRLAEYYSLADVYVCTSLSDAQPNTCLEALGCGTPILGFNVSGVPYVANKPYGVFIDTISGEALSDSIKSMPPKDQAMIDGCREYAISRFSENASEERLRQFVDILDNKIKNDKGAYYNEHNPVFTT